MKIRFYTNSYFPDPIGIAFYNTEWVEQLAALGHEVEVLTALPYYPQWKIADGYQHRCRVHERIGSAKVTRTWVYVPRRQTPFGRFLCELSFMISSWPDLVRGRPDLVIAVSPPFGVGLAAACLKRIKHVPLWLHLQDLQVDAGQAVGFFRREWLIGLLKALERWMVNQADRLTTISAPMRERVIGKGIAAGQIDLFPNWVDTARMRPLPRQNGFRAAHELGDRFVVLYAGNIGIHQGLDFLLEAASRLVENKEIVFVIAGDGNYRDQFAHRLAQTQPANVVLLPLQPKEALADMLSSADVGIVMETRQMANLSLPSKSLNQMACGRALIAVTAPEAALARMLSTTGAGLRVAPGNAEQLAIEILELSRSPERLERMGKAGRTFIEEEAAKEKIWASLPALLTLRENRLCLFDTEYRLKRLLDVSLALLGFLVSSPFWILAPLAILLEDGLPIFHGQERVGRHGRRFHVYKFRSMHRMELPQFNRRQASRGDARITRVGGWLRRTAMDEIPQLWNILKGDMSFVGPRALLPSEVEVRRALEGDVPLEQVPGYQRRMHMRPGLTGIAQVYAARDISRRHKFRFDGLYLKRQSLLADLLLILRSGWNSVTGHWEKVGQKSLEKDRHPLYARRGDHKFHV